MPTFLSGRKRSGEGSSTVVAALLGLLIISGIALGIYGYIRSNAAKEAPNLPITMKCTKCDKEFGTTQNDAAQHLDMKVKLIVMDCPNPACGASKTCLEETVCPKCSTKFILPSMKAMFEGDDPVALGKKDVCPNPSCNLNLAEYEIQKRQEAAGR